MLYFFRIVKEQPITLVQETRSKQQGEERVPLASGFGAAVTPTRGPIPKLDGGAGRDRTDDPLLAKQVLSQLSYSPSCFAMSVVGLDGFEPSTPALSRRCSNQLSYRPLSGNRGRTGVRGGVAAGGLLPAGRPNPRSNRLLPIPFPVTLQQPISVSTGTRGRFRERR